MFALPRADWIASNESLMAALAADPDFEVALAAPPDCPIPRALADVRVVAYPFYEPPPHGTPLERWRAHLASARRRRAAIDRAFAEFAPDCLVVISDTSRELLPFVRLARRHGALVVFMQSVFLAASLARHVRGENWDMLKRRGVRGAVDLLAVRSAHAIGGLPACILKSPAMGRSADVVFAINEHQRRILAETAVSARIEAVGTPFLDFLHRAADDTPRRTDRARFAAALRIDPSAPVAAYFSKSLQQFCHADPVFERGAQEGLVQGFLDRFDTAVLVVKLHPIEDARAFQSFEGHPRVRITKDAEVHELIHHSALVISLGPSTPAFHAIFHRRPRLIVVRIGDVVLEYQRDLLDVSVCARSHEEYGAALDELRTAGWPAALPARFRACDGRNLERFTQGFDGAATLRVHARLRALLGVAA
jgi:hypothetical protein